MNPSPPVQAVLFDLDGTLLDTAPDLVGALNQLREEHGLPPLAFEPARELVSHGATALVRFAFPRAGEAEFADLRRRFLDLYRKGVATRTRLFAGLDEALMRLEAASIPWGIVTNKPAWLTDPLLEEMGLRQRAHVVVSGDSLAERKPHPAQLLHAAQQLGLAPTQCLYIGDAERDVLAARGAGMPVYVALFGYIPQTEQPRGWAANGWLETPRALAQLLDSVLTAHRAERYT